VVVDERFVLRVRSNLDLARAAEAPLRGIATYSPMRRQGVTKGKNVDMGSLEAE
jgi:alcohol dehydrogenase (NADP+)